MADLIREGKIRHIGEARRQSPRWNGRTKVHPITALQTEYSLWTRDRAGRAGGLRARLGIGFVPYRPVGKRGFSPAIQRRRI